MRTLDQCTLDDQSMDAGGPGKEADLGGGSSVKLQPFLQSSQLRCCAAGSLSSWGLCPVVLKGNLGGTSQHPLQRPKETALRVSLNDDCLLAGKTPCLTSHNHLPKALCLHSASSIPCDPLRGCMPVLQTGKLGFQELGTGSRSQI